MAEPRNRMSFLVECDLDPGSLVGSWFHKLENDEIVWQGQVVAEPQAGVYLCEIERLAMGAENIQKVITLSAMADDSGNDEWWFYDTQDKARAAYGNWLAIAKERT